MTDPPDGAGEVADFSIAECIEQIALWPYGMPVRLMEAVLEIGAPAIADVALALARAEDDDERELLWLVVLLGEIGHADGVAPLIRQMCRTEVEIPAQAAVEALAKIGAASVPALLQIAQEGDVVQRLYAYAALGWIDDESAYAALVDALGHDTELADVIAAALLEQGRPDAVPRLFEAYRNCEPWQREEIETAMNALHHGWRPEPLWMGDWRLRYRPRPEMNGAIDLEWPDVALTLRESEEARGERAKAALRPLEEILADAPDVPEDPETCEECGDPIEQPMGVPVCPQTALASGLHQLSVIQAAREDGIDDLFELLDELEEDDFVLRDRGAPRRARARELYQDELADLAEARATCRWLIERGVEEVAAGEAMLTQGVTDLAERYGDPEGWLAAAAPPRARAAKIGRNDPCPCGSGRKYKRCCLEAAGDGPASSP